MTYTSSGYTINWPSPSVTTSGPYAYTGYTYGNSPNFVTYTTETSTTTEGSKSKMQEQVLTVQLAAGHVGQVLVFDSTGSKVILWESKPKKTLSKADKAAKKAQVRAAKRSFE